MKFGLGVNANETVAEIIEKSIEAERLGIDFVWVSDLPAQLYAPAVASVIAEKTRNIRIGLGLISPLLHTPTQIANSFSTLIEVYGERFELCIGPGDRNQLNSVGISLSPPEGITNYLINAKNQIEKIMQTNKTKGRIWVGAQGPKMLGIAHQFEGVLLNYAHPDLVKWATSQIGPVNNKDFQLGLYAPSYVYKDLDPKIQGRLKISSAIVALNAPKTIQKHVGLYQKTVEAKKKLNEGFNVASALSDMPIETVECFSIFKSFNSLEAYLTELTKLNIDHVVFSYPQNHSKKTVRDLAYALRDIRKRKTNI